MNKRKRKGPLTPHSPRTSSFFAGSAQRQQKTLIASSDESSFSEETTVDAVPSPSAKRRKSQGAIILSSDDDKSGRLKEQSSSLFSRRSLRLQKSTREDSRPANGDVNGRNGLESLTSPVNHDSLVQQSSIDDSDDEPIVSPQTTKRLHRLINGPKLVSNKAAPISKRRGKAHLKLSSESDDSSDDPLQISPQPRRLRRSHSSKDLTPDESSGDTSEEDIREDVDFLRDSNVVKRRTRGGPAASDRNARQQQLEKLKQRRSKNGVSSDVEQRSPADNREYRRGNDRRPISVSSEDESDGDISGGSNLDDSVQNLPNEDEEVEDFVVSDDDAPLGAPADLLNDIPIEFTHHAHKKPIEYFQHVVEWMVHNKLNPAFSRHDAIYKIAVRKLDDEIKGLMGSKFMSSVWRPEFQTTLTSRPELYSLDIPTMFEQKCGACNRSKHPPTQSLTFQGKPYDPQSLEPIDDDSGSDSSASSSESSRTSSHSSGTDTKTFNLGSHCASNAQTAHSLHHWRYHLNQHILSWLTSEGHTSRKRIIEREKWSQKKKERFANGIVDGMVEDGEMKKLYREFRENLEAARGAEVGAGWARGR